MRRFSETFFPALIKRKHGVIAPMVERCAGSAMVVGSNPTDSTSGLGEASRLTKMSPHGLVAPMVEQLLCTQKAVGSNPTRST